SDLPGPAREPRERGLRRAEVAATGGDAEATDVVHESARVDERVLVRAVHLDPVIVIGDALAARGADERALIAGGSILLRDRGRSAVSLAVEEHETSVE